MENRWGAPEKYRKKRCITATDSEWKLLREVMNTVGERGKLGEQVI